MPERRFQIALRSLRVLLGEDVAIQTPGTDGDARETAYRLDE